MKGREPLYLKPGMDEAELFAQFNARNPYYRYIAARLVEHVRGKVGRIGQAVDVLGRTGYVTRAAAARRNTIIENRAPFVEYLRNEFVAEPAVEVIEEEPVRALSTLRIGLSGDAVLCCEQASLLQPRYSEFVSQLSECPSMILGLTLGPSYHVFQTLRVADYRSGVVKDGEVMSELSHPIRQAVHAEVVRIARERYGFDRGDAWPPAAKAFDPAEVRSANDEAGFGRTGFGGLVTIEEVFRVPGHQIHLYDQNGWTFFMRWPPLSDLSQEDKIALLTEAIEAVRARPEYDVWCQVEAYHPVAFYLTWK